MGSAVNLSVVIPFFNENESARPLLAEVRAVLETSGALGGSTMEVIAVDDGSLDGTGQELDRAAAEWPVLRVVHHRQRRGQSAALATGFAAAGGELIATLDGDGQSDPADIPALLRELGEFQMVTGIRARRLDSWVRRASSRVAYRIRNAVLHDGIVDTGCSTRVLRRACLCDVPMQFRGMHRFLPALFQMAGFSVKQVPVRHRPRLGGRAKYGIGNRMIPAFLDLMAVRWMKSRFAPPERGR
jgi:dolichol-phosphate mannosyltransferase